MNVVNWQNAYDKSSNFKSSGPPKWAFVKEFLNRDFYEELYNTFPKFDDTWNVTDNEEKFAYRKFWKIDDKYMFEGEYKPLLRKSDTIIGYCYKIE